VSELYRLAQRQTLPLESKVRLAMMRVRAWHIHWDGDVCIILQNSGSSLADLVLVGVVREVFPLTPISLMRRAAAHPIVPFVVGMDAEKRDNWLEYGCNAFDAPFPECRPLSVWTKADLQEYAAHLP
jgi:hypothetical protein